VSKILKKYFLWFVALVGASVVMVGAQRVAPLAHDPQGASCCQQAGMVSPGFQLVYLAIAHESATRSVESQRWSRDFVLALEKRRAKRQARLMLKTASHSVLPLALLKAGAH
jgi:hypothetical protein